MPSAGRRVMRQRNRRVAVLALLTLILTLPAGLLHIAAAEPLTILDDCATHIGLPGAPAGYDVNGNATCSDREVSIDAAQLPSPYDRILADFPKDTLCLVTSTRGGGAPFLGYGRNGDYRGAFDALYELPRDGSVAPGGLNGDGDCADSERPNDFKELHYYALGDSVASGHGLMDNGGDCRRSERAYPMVVRDLLAERYETVHFPEDHFLACSGSEATIADDGRTLTNQVEQLLPQLTDDPTLVTITIGANDFDWTDPLNFASRLYGRGGESFEEWVADVTTRIQQHLHEDISRLLEHDNVTVVVTEYYNPFNTDSVFFLSLVDGRCGFRDCDERAAYGIEQLNLALKEVVTAFALPQRVTMTSGLFAAFEAHKAPRESCGNHAPAVDDTWIQHRTDESSNSNPSIYPWFGDRWGDWHGDCFHPNAEGARQIAAFVDQAAVSVGR